MNLFAWLSHLSCYLFHAIQMLQILAEMKLVAVLDSSGSIWVSVSHRSAHLLDRCCTGQKDGGPETAFFIHAIIQSWTQSSEQGGDQETIEEPIAIRLSLEESFFLKHVLNALTVIQVCDGVARELSDLEFWNKCRKIRTCFVTSYAGYHHLKSKGWLPRSGLLYGVDYVSYQVGRSCVLTH